MSLPDSAPSGIAPPPGYPTPPQGPYRVLPLFEPHTGRSSDSRWSLTGRASRFLGIGNLILAVMYGTLAVLTFVSKRDAGFPWYWSASMALIWLASGCIWLVGSSRISRTPSGNTELRVTP
jgi:hypothetical protein